MKFRNENGIIIEIVEEDEKYVTYKSGINFNCVEKESFYNMLRLNNYKEVK